MTAKVFPFLSVPFFFQANQKLFLFPDLILLFSLVKKKKQTKQVLAS